MCKRAIVIGGGPAGLTAAYELLKQDSSWEVFVLEEQEHLGGISATLEHNGNRMDLGGHRFFTKSKEVSDIWFELFNKQTAPARDGQAPSDMSTILETEGTDGDPEVNNNVMLERRRVSRIFYKGKFFDYPVKLNFNLFKTLGLKDTFRVGFGYIATWFKKLPETNLENFYINRFGKPLYEMFFKSYTTKLWGIPPSELDASWGAQRVKGLSVWAVLKEALFKTKKHETSLIDKFYYPKLGPGQMWDLMSNAIEYMGGVVNEGCKVTQITARNDGYYVSWDTPDGVHKKVYADAVFSSTSIKELSCIVDGFDSDIRKVATNLHYRDFQTAGILVNKLSLENKTKIKTPNNIIPDCWIYIQDSSVVAGRIQIFNNWSPYLVKDPDKCWISLEYFCNEGDEQWSCTDEEFFRIVRDDLQKLGIVAADDIIDITRKQVRKAYPVYDDAYRDFDKVKEHLLIEYPNLFCIGRNGQHRYNNLDHSMLTACEAVRVLLNKADPESVWCVNTEKEYHEEKKDD